MATQTQQTASVAGVNVQRFWYVPDRRLRTKKASADAIAILDWTRGRVELDVQPDDLELFAALHTCAYRVVCQPRNRTVSEAERTEWAERWKAIREHVVEKNLGLVYAMISRFGSKKLDEDDLLSDAMLGLSRAVDRFNPWRGYRFSTYACNVIARALMRRGKRESNYRRLFPVQFDTTFERPENLPDFAGELYVERLGRVLDTNSGELSDMESEILARRFPANRRDRLTFQEIGNTVGLSKERVRQIQNIALRKLRSALAADPVLQ